MKDFTMISISLALIGGISWFFFGKKSNHEKNESLSGELELYSLISQECVVQAVQPE
jgi:Cu2+-exporting ATPase